MNIYDEVFDELQEYVNEYGMDYYATNHFPKTMEFIEHAKKEHELLGWYRLLPNSNWTTWVRAMQNIKKLEKELEEMK